MTDPLRQEAEALANELDQLFRQKHKYEDVVFVVLKAFKAQRAAEVRAIQKMIHDVLRLGADIPDHAASLEAWLDQRAKDLAP